MNRKIKFRYYRPSTNVMIYPTTGNFNDLTESEDWKVMQFTGAIDNKGKEIYEGDIVKLLGAFHPRYRPINYCEYGSRFEIGELGLSFGQMKKDGYVDCEVVGNVFENPDLIKFF